MRLRQSVILTFRVWVPVGISVPAPLSSQVCFLDGPDWKSRVPPDDSSQNRCCRSTPAKSLRRSIPQGVVRFLDLWPKAPSCADCAANSAPAAARHSSGEYYGRASLLRRHRRLPAIVDAAAGGPGLPRVGGSGRPTRSSPVRGELAIVLHTHMPYVEGFGTWPFGEEWLWEAIATCYLPLLDVLEPRAAHPVADPGAVRPARGPRRDRPLPGVPDEIRPGLARLDIGQLRAGRGRRGLVAELERSAAEYAAAAERLAALPDGLLAALGAHASWTSSATHAVLPLLATDAASRCSCRPASPPTGAASATGRGGFWLPECAYAPWLDPRSRRPGCAPRASS